MHITPDISKLIDLSIQEDYSINVPKFLQILTDIRDKIGDNFKVYLFMDNASYHKHDDVKQAMKELNIEPVMNVSYGYRYNGIE